MSTVTTTKDPWEALYPDNLAKQEAMRFRSKIYTQLIKIVREKGMTARDLELKLNERQPRISDLLRGKLENFSAERLNWYLKLLGYVNPNEYVEEKRTV